MNLQEAKMLVLQVLRHVMEEKLDEHNVQLAQVSFILAGITVELQLTCSMPTLRTQSPDRFLFQNSTHEKKKLDPPKGNSKWRISHSD